MNKTVTINISGIIFHIEEDAYDKLSKYLTTIKGYFRNTEGRDEIVSDIESRIAEMLQAKVSPTKQVVMMSDVEQVISVMGKPEDFAGEEREEQKAEAGTGAQTEQGETPKRHRIFRDPDDKILGGVCSGIAHYFGIEPLWLRLALAISLFVFGFGFLLYILLWIIIPQAKTTAEKLEMKGETVNINNIHKSFTDEMDDLKKKMQDLKNNMGSPENKDKVRKGVGRFGAFLEEFFHMFGKVIGKFFAAIFILIGVGLMIGLLASVFGFHSQTFHFGINDSGIGYNDNGSTHISIRGLFHLFFNDGQPYLLPFITVMLLFGVPFLMLIYHGIRILFGLGKSNKAFRIVAALLWSAGLILSFYIGYGVTKQFEEKGNSKDSQVIKPAGNTLYVHLSANTVPGNDYESTPHKNDWHFMRLTENEAFLGYPSFDIVASRTDSFEISVISSAHGLTEKEAMTRAKDIHYSFSVHDSVLELDPGYSFPIQDKWRLQRVHILVKVPRNKIISLAKNIRPLVHNSDIENLQDTYDDDMVGRKWMMTADGLNCVDCDGLKHHHSEP